MSRAVTPGPWLESVEAESVAAMGLAASPGVALALGLEVRRWGKAVGLCTARADVLALNRVIGLGTPDRGTKEDLDEMLSWFAGNAVPRCFVQLAPGARPAELPGWLQWRGLVQYNNWAKLLRALTALPPRRDTPRVTRLTADQGLLFGRMVATSFGWPDATAAWLAESVGARGWHHYAAVDRDDAPLGVAALHVSGKDAYLSFAATSAEHRGRGAQTALVVHRLHEAAAAGCHRVVAETAEDTAAGPAPSFRNLRRLGFELAYLRANYLWQAPRSAA